MDFRGRVENFEEADRRYEELARKREAGDMSGEDFDAEARQLMVRESGGRWWAKLGDAGEWHYRDGGDWVPGTPPNYEKLPPTNLGREDSRQSATAVSSSSSETKKRRRMPAWIPIAAILGILILVGVVAFATLPTLFQSDGASGGAGEGMGVGQSAQENGGGQAEGSGNADAESAGAEGAGSEASFETVFVHRATGDTISNNSTFIDNPATNSNPDAVLIVTQNWNPSGEGGTYNNHPIGVWYESGREQWAVFNQDREPMTVDASFNVAVR